jgi:hypothetical protein
MTNIDRRVARVCDGQWVQVPSEWTSKVDSTAEVVRIRASDLQEARAVTGRIRARDSHQGRSSVVYLDLQYHVAVDARTARLEASQFAPADAGSVRYVGTPAGLGGLIDDIATAGVADGVTLLPLGPEDTVPPLGLLAGTAVDSRLRSS